MSEVKVVGRGVDTLVLNVCYADTQFLPVKQELAEDLQNELNLLQGTGQYEAILPLAISSYCNR